MTSSWLSFFSDALVDATRQGLRRTRGGPAELTALDFGSNDYLGLRDHSAIREAIARVVTEQGWGSGASPLLRGYSALQAELEAALAAHCQTQSALAFSSGYACNIGAVACLADAADAIYSDQLNHASLIDGVRLSKTPCVVYPHKDVEFVARELRQNRHRFRRVMVVTESLFSMDGDLADLQALLDLSQHYECGLVIDEAHATGVYGEFGGGLLEQLALEPSPQGPLLLKLGTLSKALGSIGGFAAGSQDAIEFLVNRCRSYMFSTAPPMAAMAAGLAALAELRRMGPPRAELRSSAVHLRKRLQAAGWNVAEGDSPIIPVIVGDEGEAMRLSQQLAAEQVYVPAIRPPTVPRGTSRLRISLSTRHTASQLERLVAALGSPRDH